MAGNFDPYYNWLGIPPKEQPPHYYRLLGIELFEADPDVIALAAEQRMLHVRSFQAGEYAIISQKMQKKIAAATACLLNAEKKSEYDISLRLHLRLHPVQSLPKAAPLPDLPPPPPPPPRPSVVQKYLEPPPAGQTARKQRGPGNKTTSPLGEVIVAVKESLDVFRNFLRRHKSAVSLIFKSLCLAMVAVIILLVFAHGKDLWTFTFDKTSYLVGKLTGSSEEKPPEHQPRIRTIPGRTPGTPGNYANSKANQIPPPPGAEDQSGSVGPPANADSAAVAETQEKSQASTTTPVSTPSQPEPPSEVTILNLPSGKIFKTRIFKINLPAVFDLFKDPAKDDPVLCIFYPGRQIRALATHDKGVLDGISMSFYENLQPMLYAVYSDGVLDGMLKTWNEKGERVYWCQYAKGVRDVFCCYFKDNSLRMLLEIDHDTISGIHLCGNGEIQKSFSSAEQASDDKVAQKLLDEVDELETILKSDESTFKKEVKDELQRLRHEKTGVMTAQKRAAIQDRINLRAMESKELNKILRNFNGL